MNEPISEWLNESVSAHGEVTLTQTLHIKWAEDHTVLTVLKSQSFVVKSQKLCSSAKWSRQRGRGTTVYWDRCTLSLHELAAADTHSAVIIAIFSNSRSARFIYFWAEVQLRLQNSSNNLPKKTCNMLQTLNRIQKIKKIWQTVKLNNVKSLLSTSAQNMCKKWAVRNILMRVS